MSSRQESFQARLARISGATPDAEAPEQDNLIADLQAYEASREAARPKLSAEEAARVINPGWRRNIGYPLSFVQAFVTGMIAVFALRFVRFHLFADSYGAIDPDTLFFLDLLLLVALFHIYRSLIANARTEEAGLRGNHARALTVAMDNKQRLIVQGAGVFFALSTMHNLYHWIPQQMSAAFSPEWTQTMVEWSAANSIYFRGRYFVLHEDEAEKRTKPRVWTIGG